MNLPLLCFIFAFLIFSSQGNLREASRVVGKPCTYTEASQGPTYKGVCKPGNQCPTSVSNIQAGIKVPWCYNKNNVLVLCCNTEKRISQVQCDKMTSSSTSKLPGSLKKSSAQETQGQTGNADKLYPFVVVLEHVTSRQKTSWSCSGALISPSYVLTSAKCVSDHEPKKVLAGAVHLFRVSPGSNFKHMLGQQESDVAQVIKHPEYNPGQAYNDIAIVKLAKPFQINEFVAPICLASPAMMASSAHNFPIMTLGWGHAKDGESSDTVQPVDIKKLDWNSCKDWGDKFRKEVDQAHNTIPSGMSKGHSCGHRMERCDADSGGPVIANHVRSGRNFLVGIITSSVTSCSREDAPLVYSNVQSHLSWIEQTVWGSGAPPSKSSATSAAASNAGPAGQEHPKKHQQSGRNMGPLQTKFEPKPNLQQHQAVNHDQHQSEVFSSANPSAQATSDHSATQEQKQIERDHVEVTSSNPSDLDQVQSPVHASMDDHQQPLQLQNPSSSQHGQQQHSSAGQSQNPMPDAAHNQSSAQKPDQMYSQVPIQLSRSQFQSILQKMAQSQLLSSSVHQSVGNSQIPVHQQAQNLAAVASAQPGQGSQTSMHQQPSQNQQQQQQQPPYSMQQQFAGQNQFQRSPLNSQFY